ncbi:protein cholesin isoform X3 [Peromyscus maniculatus bairdii]|uniref:protein cholesin isoform X3 n=1 Tax=Peromyscus maniculatus bairdii TaxID=230844 RepID=UPI003FD1F022
MEIMAAPTWVFRTDQPPPPGTCQKRTGKVQEASPELSPEERRVLERKLKKERKKEEKKRLREAGIAAAPTAKGQTLAAKPSAAVLALEYLQGWAQKQKSWRFQKTRQTWLLLNMYDEDKVPDEHFSTLLDYLEGLKGSARELTVQKAEALMQELDEADPEPRDAGLRKMERLRQVLQLLS